MGEFGEQALEHGERPWTSPSFTSTDLESCLQPDKDLAKLNQSQKPEPDVTASPRRAEIRDANGLSLRRRSGQFPVVFPAQFPAVLPEAGFCQSFGEGVVQVSDGGGVVLAYLHQGQNVLFGGV